MRAIVTKKYGSVEVLEHREVERPVIRDEEILVQVIACSVNPVDWKIRRGDARLLTGRKPPRILGCDYAGIVAEVGGQVTNYKSGDAVWGMVNALRGGTYAEFSAVKREEIGMKPNNLSFEEAASIPLVGLTAYQSLVYEGRVKKGDHIIINGCSGGVGLAGLQIAKALGCKVTGVCSAKNLQLARKRGADEVIDYTKGNMLRRAESCDIFFDAVANQSFFRARTVVKPGGAYVTTVPSFQSMVMGPLINRVGARKVKYVFAKPNTHDLAILKEMVESGKVVPVVEKVYSLDQIREAHTRSETGRVVGKIVLKVVDR